MAEPNDAVPAEHQAAPSAENPRALKRARIAWLNFRTSGRIVGVRISEDGTEIWSHGIGKPHYPAAGAHATVEDRGAVIVFKAPTYELAINVPKGGIKHSREFAGKFNTWAMNGAYVPPAV